MAGTHAPLIVGNLTTATGEARDFLLTRDDVDDLSDVPGGVVYAHVFDPLGRHATGSVKLPDHTKRDDRFDALYRLVGGDAPERRSDEGDLSVGLWNGIKGSESRVNTDGAKAVGQDRLELAREAGIPPFLQFSREGGPSMFVRLPPGRYAHVLFRRPFDWDADLPDRVLVPLLVAGRDGSVLGPAFFAFLSAGLSESAEIAARKLLQNARVDVVQKQKLGELDRLALAHLAARRGLSKEDLAVLRPQFSAQSDIPDFAILSWLTDLKYGPRPADLGIGLERALRQLEERIPVVSETVKVFLGSVDFARLVLEKQGQWSDRIQQQVNWLQRFGEAIVWTSPCTTYRADQPFDPVRLSAENKKKTSGLVRLADLAAREAPPSLEGMHRKAPAPGRAADRSSRNERERQRELVRRNEPELVEKLVGLNRVAKVVKGGRRFGFAALVIVGDQRGQVGYGAGKAREVPEAIRKATEAARRAMIRVPLREGRTLHHDISGHFGAGRVRLRAAPAGTGIIAGGPMRAIFEALGVHDVVAKSLGTSNPHNMIKATFDALTHVQSPRAIASKRGKSVAEIFGRSPQGAAAQVSH